MARKQSSFNYDELDSATQDFLRQKEGEINPLLDRRQLLYRYRIGKKLVEVQKFLEEKKENCYYPWLKEVFTIPPSTIDEHTYCYTYTNEYLGGIAALEANPKIKYSVLFKLGRPKTPENIKQQFAVRINSGEEVTHQEVQQSIDALLKTIPSNQIDDLEKPLIEIKDLLNSQDNKE